MQTYTFVNDVLMKDFPPQIFLQRPAIIKVYLICILCDWLTVHMYTCTCMILYLHAYSVFHVDFLLFIVDHAFGVVVECSTIMNLRIGFVLYTVH